VVLSLVAEIRTRAKPPVQFLGASSYLIFGGAEEKPTAVPRRDFIIYLLQPFEPAGPIPVAPDEVVIRLAPAARDETFDRALRRYAAAQSLAGLKGQDERKQYLQRADAQRPVLVNWLRNTIETAFTVSYEGTERPLGEIMAEARVPPSERRDLAAVFDRVCAHLLARDFGDRFPDYPAFAVEMRDAHRAAYCTEALSWLADITKTKPGAAVLEALALRDGDTVTARGSRFADDILRRLDGKGPGQVVNRSDLIQGAAPLERWSPFALEPEFLAVTVAALVHQGDIVVKLDGAEYDATKLNQLARLGAARLSEFSTVMRPRDLPIAAWKEVLELLGMPTGLLSTDKGRTEAVREMQLAVPVRIDACLDAQRQLSGGLQLWGRALLSEPERQSWADAIGRWKDFLEALKPFDTPAKLKSFRIDAEAVKGHRSGRDLVRQVEGLSRTLARLAPLVQYLSDAERALPPEHPWLAGLREARTEVQTALADPVRRADPLTPKGLEDRLAALKADYVEQYRRMHANARLTTAQDQQRRQLETSEAMRDIERLAQIPILPRRRLDDLKVLLDEPEACHLLTAKEMEAAALCPHCSFRPADDPMLGRDTTRTLIVVEEMVADLRESWISTLHTELTRPEVEKTLRLLDPAHRQMVDDFIEDGSLPPPIEPDFIAAATEALQRLETVLLDPDALIKALRGTGTPVTPEEIRKRFDRAMKTLLQGKSETAVRVVVEKCR